MSVNLSSRQFRSSNLADQIKRVLRQTGLEPRALKLEITESVLMDDANGAAARMHALTDLGVRFASTDPAPLDTPSNPALSPPTSAPVSLAAFKTKAYVRMATSTVALPAGQTDDAHEVASSRSTLPRICDSTSMPFAVSTTLPFGVRKMVVGMDRI